MKSKGITLIALMVTIIVMLILVTVSIRLVISGGIINRTRYGVNSTQFEMDREELILAVAGSYDEYTGGIIRDELVKNLISGWTVRRV